MMNLPALQTVLLLFLLYGIVQRTTCCEDLTCFVDYIETLTCTYKTGHRGTNRMSYNLTATWTTDSQEKDMPPCNFIQSSRNGSHAEFICTISMTYFESEDKFTVRITETDSKDYNASKECPAFAAIENFKPCPPFNLTISLSDEYNVSWQTEYESNYLLEDELQYELRYKKKNDTRENPHTVPVTRDVKSVLLLRSSFQVNTEYVAWVRTRPGSASEYKGVWSDWSSSVSWRTEEGKEESLSILSPWLFGVLSLLGTGFMFFMVLKMKRIWKQVWVLSPDPKHFFKPLYKGHNGDFKSWLGAYHTMTIDFFDWGIVLPEVLQVYKHLPQPSSKADFKDIDKHHKLSNCKSCLPIHSKEHSKSMHCSVTDGSGITDRSYGHVSIDTVTVANEVTSCCPQCACNRLEGHDRYVDDEDDSGDNDYSTMNLNSGNGHIESKLLMADSSIQDDIISSGSTPMASCRRHEIEPLSESMQGSLTRSLGPNMNILDLLCMQHDEWDLESPVSYRAADDESVSYDSDAEDFGYPIICLDLDTIDSGFVDSDCGSPTECEFEKNNITQTDSSDGSGSVQLQEAEQCPRSYVKQWISCNSTISSSESQMS